jgi:hypothetical protein
MKAVAAVASKVKQIKPVAEVVSKGADVLGAASKRIGMAYAKAFAGEAAGEYLGEEVASSINEYGQDIQTFKDDLGNDVTVTIDEYGNQIVSGINETGSRVQFILDSAGNRIENAKYEAGKVIVKDSAMMTEKVNPTSGNYETTQYVQTAAGLVPVQVSKAAETKDNKMMYAAAAGAIALVFFMGNKGKRKK